MLPVLAMTDVVALFRLFFKPDLHLHSLIFFKRNVNGRGQKRGDQFCFLFREQGKGGRRGPCFMCVGCVAVCVCCVLHTDGQTGVKKAFFPVCWLLLLNIPTHSVSLVVVIDYG
jgi:hypothetical protein